MMPLELFKSRLETRILQLLVEFEDDGEIPESFLRIETVFRRRSVILHIATGEEQLKEGRTECQRDCLAILKQTGQPMTRLQIAKKLEEKGILWGESTIATTLATLHHEGVLENSRKKGGYYLPNMPS